MSGAHTTTELPTTQRPRFRNLRIAVSAFFGVLTLLLVVLWVRSYWRSNFVSIDGPQIRFVVGAVGGRIGGLGFEPKPTRTTISVNYDSSRVSDDWIQRIREQSRLGILYEPGGFLVPAWTIAIVAAIAAYLPWAGFCFSLRSLLIAMALVAVVLGLAVWAMG
jgi:hypothetical protein